MPKRNSTKKLKNYNSNDNIDLFDGDHVYNNLKTDLSSQTINVILKYFHTRNKLDIHTNIPALITKSSPLYKRIPCSTKTGLVLYGSWSDDVESNPKHDKMSVLEIDLELDNSFAGETLYYVILPCEKVNYDETNNCCKNKDCNNPNIVTEPLFIDNTSKGDVKIAVLDKYCDIIIPKIT